MLNEKVYFGEDKKVCLEAWCQVKERDYCPPRRKAILIFPGGGYGFCSQREADPVAREFFAREYNVFILYYSCADSITNENGYPKPLLEASYAMNFIRENAEKYNIIEDKIAVIGFSAGGHLAGCLAAMWHYDFISEQAKIKKGTNKPCAAVLCYPVITLNPEYTHAGTAENLLSGSKSKDEDRKFYSLENQVSDKTCPCFIWHTADDGGVPVQNSFLFANALSEKGIPFELHVFPEGVHGSSVATPDVFESQNPKFLSHIHHWVDEAARFLEYYLQ